MTTMEELDKLEFANKNDERKASFKVTAAEMKRFEVNNSLALKVYNKINDYCKTHNIKPKYEGLEERCQLSASTLNKSCGGKIKITRLFLYKFTVGLKMSVSEANEFFMLCGGELNVDNPEDLICRNALRDGDDIISFIDEFNDYIKKYDKFLTTDKLKKLYE